VELKEEALRLEDLVGRFRLDEAPRSRPAPVVVLRPENKQIKRLRG
jgi:hypothetical protein